MSLESTSNGESQVSTQQRVGKVLPESSGSVESEGGDPHAESMIGSNHAVVDGDWAYFVVSESGLNEEQKSRIFQGRAIEEYRTLDEALAKASV